VPFGYDSGTFSFTLWRGRVVGGVRHESSGMACRGFWGEAIWIGEALSDCVPGPRFIALTAKRSVLGKVQVRSGEGSVEAVSLTRHVCGEN
jgi:hypothetical protein